MPCGNEYIGVGVKTEKFAAHLFGQVVGDNNQCFIAQPQALFLHRGSAHNHCLTCADRVGYQGVAAKQNSGYCVTLMGSKRDLRVHTRKTQKAAIVLAGSQIVVVGVVVINQSPPPVGISVYPILKSGFNLLLLILSQAGFFNIGYSLLLPVYIFDIIYNLDSLQVQAATQNFIEVFSLCTESGCSLQVVAVYGTPFDVPGSVEPVVADFYRLCRPAIWLHRLQNELLDILWRNPGSSKV